ncbi:MAG: carbamoyltransferase HypF [Bacteroidales bacterium]|nr:carbamoyltransferase HypF [Bacteroidales bacterium]
MMIALKIKIEGLVQGIGFRPFVYRLAKKHQINGYVHNLSDGVEIIAQAEKKSLNRFLDEMVKDAPAASEIQEINTEVISPGLFNDFTISGSTDISDAITEISPDISVCDDCLKDMRTQSHRINYPLINCTNCGPRFTITRDLPYDRVNTTMQPFEMCDQCRAEYEDISDRRFHAQPVACNKCGPKYEMFSGGRKIMDFDRILNTLSDYIRKGKIIAFKGTGGYHLMCDALDEHAVSRLRKLKKREGKPFAVMFRNLDAVREFAEVNSSEAEILTSWRKPIVLLEMKKQLAPSVALGLKTIGAFLPYMPIHYLLFEKITASVLVLTSGNLSDEPIITGDEDAREVFGTIADAIISYNREIYNRTDDSVVTFFSGKERILRRSRGYAPAPVMTLHNVEGILATGAELVNCFCIGKGYQSILSQHIGDLKNIETYRFYTETVEKYKRLFRFNPLLVAHDMHPDYFSTRYALELNIESIPVQHHHAHIASCMAEHGIDEKVIGVSFDGTGYGPDGNIWGSEFLLADLDSFERYSHFEYIALPGGDKVTEEPWRTAISYLYNSFGRELKHLDIPFISLMEGKKLDLILEALDKKINCPLSSGAGRLFDAIAALTNICHFTKFHAEAPMRLESLTTGSLNQRYEVSHQKETISFKEMFQQIIEDIHQETPVEIIATKFHNTFIYTIFRVSLRIRSETGLNKVVLSGGTFQNKYIMERLEPLLIKNKFEVFSQNRIPCNDGGIALGQQVIAAKMRK